jgi:hypothetical protein
MGGGQVGREDHFHQPDVGGAFFASFSSSSFTIALVSFTLHFAHLTEAVQASSFIMKIFFGFRGIFMFFVSDIFAISGGGKGREREKERRKEG